MYDIGGIKQLTYNESNFGSLMGQSRLENEFNNK